jgi:hypothetical protein
VPDKSDNISYSTVGGLLRILPNAIKRTLIRINVHFINGTYTRKWFSKKERKKVLQKRYTYRKINYRNVGYQLEKK